MLVAGRPRISCTSLMSFFSTNWALFVLRYLDGKDIACLCSTSYGIRMRLREYGYYDAIQVFKLYYFHLMRWNYANIDNYKLEIMAHFRAIHDSMVIGNVDDLFFEDDNTRYEFISVEAAKLKLRYRPIRAERLWTLCRNDSIKCAIPPQLLYKILVSTASCVVTIIEAPRVGPYALAQLRVTPIQLRALNYYGTKFIPDHGLQDEDSKENVFSKVKTLKLYNLGIIYPHELRCFANVKTIFVSGCYEMTNRNLRFIFYNRFSSPEERTVSIYFEGTELLVGNETKTEKKCCSTKLSRQKRFISMLLDFVQKGLKSMSKHLLPRIRVFNMFKRDLKPTRNRNLAPKSVRRKYTPSMKMRKFSFIHFVDIHDIYAISMRDDDDLPPGLQREHGISSYDHVIGGGLWLLPIPLRRKELVVLDFETSGIILQTYNLRHDNDYYYSRCEGKEVSWIYDGFPDDFLLDVNNNFRSQLDLSMFMTHHIIKRFGLDLDSPFRSRPLQNGYLSSDSDEDVIEILD